MCLAQSPSAASAGALDFARTGERVPGDERAEAQLAVAQLDPVQPEAADVDEPGRARDPELHRGQERLAAGEGSRVRLGERLQRLLQGRRADVLELGRDHVRSASPAARIESTTVWYPVQRQ